MDSDGKSGPDKIIRAYRVATGMLWLSRLATWGTLATADYLAGLGVFPIVLYLLYFALAFWTGVCRRVHHRLSLLLRQEQLYKEVWKP